MDRSFSKPVYDYTRQHLEEFLTDLRLLVSIDSGTYSKAGVDAVGAWFERRFASYGWETGRLPGGSYGDCRTAIVRGTGSARLLLVGHMDTVFSDGTAADRPMTIEGDVLRGPAAADMKAGLLGAMYAARGLQESGYSNFDRIVLFFNSDEEVSSPVSQALYRPYGEESDAAFVFECGRENGDLVSARKGGGEYGISVEGKSAHAGVAPETGANAIVQLSRLVDLAAGLNGLRPGVTVNAGVIKGGSRANVVPDFAEVELDVRAADKEGEEAVHAALYVLADRVTVSGTKATVSGRFSGSAMVKTPGNAMLAEIAIAVGAELGFQVKDGPMTGGRSDGNYLAALGLPVLDGMGPVGGHGHSPNEFLLVSSIPERVALAAGTIATACERVEELRRLKVR